MTEFEKIASMIVNNEEYKKLLQENHHGINRYEHSYRVAKATYIIAKKLGLDYVSATRAALLHDFFTNVQFNDIKGLDQGRIHPLIALDNAKKEFAINDIEENAIETHMFPLTKKRPKTKESLILNVADKSVALYEYSRFKMVKALKVGLLFIINVITFSSN